MKKFLIVILLLLFWATTDSLSYEEHFSWIWYNPSLLSLWTEMESDSIYYDLSNYTLYNIDTNSSDFGFNHWNMSLLRKSIMYPVTWAEAYPQRYLIMVPRMRFQLSDEPPFYSYGCPLIDNDTESPIYFWIDSVVIKWPDNDELLVLKKFRENKTLWKVYPDFWENPELYEELNVLSNFICEIPKEFTKLFWSSRAIVTIFFNSNKFEKQKSEKYHTIDWDYFYGKFENRPSAVPSETHYYLSNSKVVGEKVIYLEPSELYESITNTK